MSLYFTLIFLLVFYGVAAYLVGSTVNGLSLLFAQMLGLELIPAILYFHVFQVSYPASSGRTEMYAYILYAGGLTVAYLMAKRRRPPREVNQASPYGRTLGWIAAIVTGGYTVLSLLTIAAGTATAPYTRAFYTSSRLGWGSYFYSGEAAALILNLVALSMFQGPLRFVFVLTALGLLAGFGSKGIILLGLLQVIFYRYIYIEHHIRLAKAGVLMLVGGAALYGVLWQFSPWARNDIGRFFLAYSDGPRNFLIEVNDWTSYRGGQISFEENLYAIVPRALDQNKPLYYGGRRVAGQFFSADVRHNQGDPSFGRFSLWWADFGPWCLCLLPILGLIRGGMIGWVESFVQNQRPDIGFFAAYLVLVGVPLIGAGVDVFSMDVLNITLALLIGLLAKAASSIGRFQPNRILSESL